MSLMTRKDQAKAQASAGLHRARRSATRVTPLARNASTTAAQGVQDARDWAAPRIEQGVQQARGWAAPRIEHAAQALEETVAPKVSEVLTATAHRIEPADQADQAKRRRWPLLVAVFAVATVAGGAIATILRRRAAQRADTEMTEEVTPTADEPGYSEADEAVVAEADVAAGNGNQARR